MDVHPPGTDLGEFKAYLLSQLLWDPSRDLPTIATEFLKGYYSTAGAVAVKNYMDTMTGSMKTEGYCRADDGQGITFPPTSPFLSPQALLASAAGFASGLKATAALAPKYHERVRRASMSTWFVILVRWDEIRQWAAANSVAWPLEATKREAYLSYLRGANASAAMNGMFCWQYGGEQTHQQASQPADLTFPLVI